MRTTLAIDIGGTFTDVVLQDSDGIHSTKILTSHQDPSDAVIDGIQKIFENSRSSYEEVSLVLHGTTLATNALIERRGAKTALLTTAGHRDILEMAFENRFEQYDVNIERPRPLVSRKLRIPIEERMNAQGEIFTSLSMESVDRALDAVVRERVESVAIGFLHSYVNDKHERIVADAVRSRLPNIEISLSSEVCPEIREYERLSTTCANAYVLPLMARYLKNLAERLGELGFSCPYLMMTSGGGLTSFDTARRFPIRLVESGPAGGAILAERLATELALDKVLSFDMGGTTAKLCLVDDGHTLLSRSFEVDRVYRFKKGSGLPIRIPVIEMVEIGAGGGSIATVDQLDRVQIGPESAGSNPGPACYGLGGEFATVTDADCLLGRLDEDYFAAGSIKLDREAAVNAVLTHVSNPLGLTNAEAALGIAEIVDENMTAAARSHASEWGKSLNDRTLVAFGGAAPLHAARLMEKMSLARVVIPTHAGVGSAIGFLSAPIAFEVVRSRHMLLSHFDSNLIGDVFDDMREEARSVISTSTAGKTLDETAHAYVRYVGQGHEVSVLLDLNALNADNLREKFEENYISMYGQIIPNADLEVMSWTLNVSAFTDHITNSATLASSTDGMDIDVRELTCVEQSGSKKAKVISRESLEPNFVIEGPVLIVEPHTTTVVPTGFHIQRMDTDHLLLERIET
ncbi:MAG: hydantoinase/oxoprolinase family protein [Gammaproteobacteria bacterium]|nr:hydantoinase/oxoprolinase family protein [Gammaproteobacteria bacterium]